MNQTLTDADVKALAGPEFSQQMLAANENELLILTQDYGSGLELRDAYVYAKNGDAWRLIAYRKSSSSEVTAKVVSKNLVLVTRAGKTILSIPVETIKSGFSKDEH